MSLLQKKSKMGPGPLLAITSKHFMDAALEDPVIEEQVAELLHRETFEFECLYVFGEHRRLFNIAFSSNFPLPTETFSIEIRITKCLLYVEGVLVASMKLSIDDSEALFYAKTAIQNGFEKFRLFVRGHPMKGEFREEILYDFRRKLGQAASPTPGHFSRDAYGCTEIPLGKDGGLQMVFTRNPGATRD
ncbi:hypothetical protein L3Y34_003905 [Caenorhabditis briggsae]|uniref:Uncharacterized protein n=1 Tax=Caenorhabditis briggsae TaxID=6238 RepID=A0AAE9AAC6_CAEBR|nr:hypothetical protein L3Y34_003905 [Caenorhabditis briggsae]